MATEKKREKLIINPATWIHREGGAASCLLRASDGKRCCMGIYLQDNCGVSPGLLRGVSYPYQLWIPISLQGSLPAWLMRSGDGMHNNNTPLVERLMSVNDDPESSEDATREEIRKLFAQADIDVEYVDNEPSRATLP